MRQKPSGFGWLSWRALAAAAALVLLAGFSVWLAVHPSGHTVEVEILQLADASFAAPHAGLREHERVKIGSLDLRSGEALLRLPSDVKLAASGPAALRFIDPMHATVLHGKVTVDVGARGKGFILDTPVTRVMDLGTRFGVDAKPDGRTDVMVIEGRVELFSLRQTRRTAELEQGEAVRVDATQALARIVNITGGTNPGEWSAQPPPGDCSISGLQDNIPVTEGPHFYRIVPHGMKAGAVAYTDRPHVWETVEGRGFPSSLAGADLVQTFHRAALHRDQLAVEVILTRPAELFVIMPKRSVPQPWLTQDFTSTGEELVLSERGARVEVPWTFEVWRRTVRQAGKIKLGPANGHPSGTLIGMYGIAAKTL